MKIAVMSYSLTGNNQALAENIAKEIAAEHIKITGVKQQTMGSIVIDIILKRTPLVQPLPSKVDNYDLVLLIGPVWMGQVATPLRGYLNYLRTSPCKYAFITVSGGADGLNPKLEEELIKRARKEPIALIDLHIADLLPSKSDAVRKETSAYRLNKEDINNLTHKSVKILREKVIF
jgi:hypothetical protein